MQNIHNIQNIKFVANKSLIHIRLYPVNLYLSSTLHRRSLLSRFVFVYLVTLFMGSQIRAKKNNNNSQKVKNNIPL